MTDRDERERSYRRGFHQGIGAVAALLEEHPELSARAAVKEALVVARAIRSEPGDVPRPFEEVLSKVPDRVNDESVPWGRTMRFEEALLDVMGPRAEAMSDDLRGTLRELFERGVQRGRSLELPDPSAVARRRKAGRKRARGPETDAQTPNILDFFADGPHPSTDEPG